jgi:soluble lytic murein transglycosylase-like protein
MRKAIIIWIAVLIAALWLNSTWAQSETGRAGSSVPEFVDGAWVLPARDSSMMAAPAGQMGGYEAAAYDACAAHGCDGAYLYNILLCESGGDPGAWHANPYGGSDVGIMQINDATWGSIAYADPYTQIDWAAQMIAAGYGSIWVCG